MKKYEINDLSRTILRDAAPVVLFGAGRYGKITHYALEKLGISPTCFCDSDPRKHAHSIVDAVLAQLAASVQIS